MEVLSNIKGLQSAKYESGGTLIILVLVLTMIVLGFTLKAANTSANAFQKYTSSSILINEAKSVLVGYSLSRTSVGERPGDLVRPDSFGATESPQNYDGDADSGCLDFSKANGLPLISSGLNQRCLGRLPVRTLGMTSKFIDQTDSTGTMPWYAVSANLVDPVCLEKINSATAISIYTGYSCASGSLPHPWLTVRDSRGNIISNRVAAIIFLPGLPLSGQSRNSLPNLSRASDYLDTVTIPIGCAAPCVPGTYSNADMDNDYIQADDVKNVPDSSFANPNYTYPYNFNDKLVFITIDELIAAVEKRAAGEARRALKDYYLASNVVPANRYFPYAAQLGDSNNACKLYTEAGLLPIAPASASCISNQFCKADFSTITNLEFANDANLSYTSITGSCSRLSNTCTCTGAGSCIKSTSPTTQLVCDATGACTSSTPGSYRYTYVPKSPDVTAINPSCTSGGSGVVICNGAGSFYSPSTNCTILNPPGLSKLPKWFTDNNWQDFIYYAVDSTCTQASPGCTAPTLRVGAESNVSSLLISSGGAIAAPFTPPFVASKSPQADQVRPSLMVENYLDSIENADGDHDYDAVGKPRTSSYNDQMFIVAP